MVVTLGWTITGTADELNIPEHTMREWAEAEEWTKLKAKAAARRLKAEVARIESPVVVVEAPSIKPVEVTTQARINTTLSQIDEIDRMLDTPQQPPLTPRARVELINAKATLWALVHPKTGTAKASKGRRAGAILQPLDEPDQAAAPQPVVGRADDPSPPDVSA